MSREVKCAACATEVFFKSDFSASHKCPQVGKESGRVCPDCSKPTVWRTGRYSTFHGCSDFPKCRGKIGAPRGSQSKEEVQKELEDNEPAPAPKVVPPEPTPAPLNRTNSFSVGDTVECVTTSWENMGGPRKGNRYEVTAVNQTGPAVISIVRQGETFLNYGVDGFKLYATVFSPETLAPQAPVTTSPNSDPLANALLASLGPALNVLIDQRAQLAAQEAIAKNGPTSLKIQWVDPKTNQVVVEIEGGHAAVREVIDLVKCGFKNILLVGPAGSGKTTIAGDIAKALKLQFGHISCTSGMSESKIVGRTIPNIADGSTKYQGTAFVDLYENGGVFLFDEIDAADPNVLLVINSAIANGHMSLEDRAENRVATRHESTVIIAAANTYGNGADRLYVGRNQLDAAFLDRFVGAIVTVDYDKDLEKALLTDAAALADIWAARTKASELKIRRVIGTRAVIAVAKHMRGGKSRKDALAAVFSVSSGWQKDELTRVGLA